MADALARGGLDLDAQKLLDVFSQYIVDFVVPGDGLFLARGRIEIDVVPPTMPQQNTPLPKQITNQLVTLQIEISMV